MIYSTVNFPWYWWMGDGHHHGSVSSDFALDGSTCLLNRGKYPSSTSAAWCLQSQDLDPAHQKLRNVKQILSPQASTNLSNKIWITGYPVLTHLASDSLSRTTSTIIVSLLRFRAFTVSTMIKFKLDHVGRQYELHRASVVCLSQSHSTVTVPILISNYRGWTLRNNPSWVPHRPWPSSSNKDMFLHCHRIIIKTMPVVFLWKLPFIGRKSGVTHQPQLMSLITKARVHPTSEQQYYYGFTSLAVPWSATLLATTTH
jgi:hypothetical protein